MQREGDKDLPTRTVSCGALSAQGRGADSSLHKGIQQWSGLPSKAPLGLRRFLLTPQCSSQGAGMSLPEADTLLLFQHPIISPFNRNPSLSLKTAGYCSHIFNRSTGLGVLSYYCSGLRSVTDKTLGSYAHTCF